MVKRERRIFFSVLLNVCFTILEAVGGFWSNSLAILSDALHDFGDSVALGSSWLLERGASRSPDSSRTFGYQRLSLFSALFSAMLLVGGSLVILIQAIPRFVNPELVKAQGVIGIAVIGIIFNGAGVLLLHKGESLNERVLSWHLLEDVVGWIAILIGGLAIHLWDIYIIDPIITVGLTIFILYNVSKNLRETLNILLQGVPRHISIDNVRQELLQIKGVLGIHDIHIWSLEGETDILTGHIVVDEKCLETPDQTRKTIKEVLKKHHIEHSTIELESKDFCSGIECKEWHKET
ncbi:MAG: cation transporter [Candidatus Bathyarchaeota archaeon]|nr:MAG: cation transporter [Candidatus Bathyarchaeota archaeon]